jgi:hypothetical protein
MPIEPSHGHHRHLQAVFVARHPPEKIRKAHASVGQVKLLQQLPVGTRYHHSMATAADVDGYPYLGG